MTEPYLDGITVLDFTQYLAGPSCTRLLMELGAEIIKVEQLPFGDPTRSFEPRVNRRSGFFVQQNRGKRSLAVDLTTDDGVELVRRLADTVDIVVENFSPGVMARKGLGWDDLSARNPRLIMVSISGFGQTGPLHDKQAFDFIAQAYTGVMHLNGETEGPPLFVGMALADTSVGVHAFGAIGHALFRRERTGRGMWIDCSMVDSLTHMHETAIYAPSITDGEYEPIRQGRYYQVSQPGAVYRGPEGWIVVFCTQGQLPGLWAAMGRPELGDDPRFVNNQARLAHREELTAVIEEWMATCRSDDDVIARLEAARVPCSKVLRPAELGEQPHLRERGTIRDVDDPRIGRVTVPGFPIRFSDAPPLPEVVAPDLGADNHDVLVGRLGLSEAEVDALEARGVIGSKDR